MSKIFCRFDHNYNYSYLKCIRKIKKDKGPIPYNINATFIWTKNIKYAKHFDDNFRKQPLDEYYHRNNRILNTRYFLGCTIDELFLHFIYDARINNKYKFNYTIKNFLKLDNYEITK